MAAPDRTRSTNAPPDGRAWFGSDEEAALRDVREVFEDALAPSESDAEHAAVLLEALRSGDFGPYEELLVRRADGDPEAAGLPRAVARRLTPHLVRAWADDAPRLGRVLDVLAELLGRSTAVLAAAAHAVQERALAESHRQLRSLAGSVEATREEERTRIARELHDELAQDLTAAAMDIGWLLPRVQEAPPEVAERLQAMATLVDSVFDRVRRIATDLRPGVLDDLGLGDAIEWQAGEFERRSGIRVEMDVSPDLGEVDRARTTAVFRMFQEMLTNVARHARARRVVGRLALEDGLVTLVVADDGRGIRPREITNRTSLGLLGMRERAEMHGGTFRIERGRAGGTVVTVRLPADGAVCP